MKYFLDTEFIEGFHKPLFGKKRHFIDLISIGIVCEDGREYYAISKEFNPKDADSWVKQNVLSKLPDRYVDVMDSPRRKMEAMFWKSKEQIRLDLLRFFHCFRDQHFWRARPGAEIYAYYADYDWVVFCSLFGRMIDLPKNMPMYCRDLKQSLDEIAQKIPVANDIELGLTSIKLSEEYPKPSNEHNALADAKWNYELYKFLQTI
jgi:hypothetical protein